jgi:hypothetical protein
VNRVLVAVFVCMSVLYIWRTGEVTPLTLHGPGTGQYNALADAFLHLRLWIKSFPAQILGPEPLNPSRLPAFLSAYGDDSLRGNKLYISWGPTPVVVLLMPLQILGFKPSDSVIIAPFVIAGLGFALATLRVMLRQISNVPLWMCTIAALTLACASGALDLMRGSEVYHEAIAGGYCFAMAGAWLAVSAVIDRRASLPRLGLMSLCFGLAAGSRPVLVFTALLLVPVFLTLKPTHPLKGLLVALTAPVATCFVLLAAYNYVRFGNPLEIGASYQIGGGTYNSYYSDFGYVPVGMWSYLLTPPRLDAIFPFLSLAPPQLSYPLSLPAHYSAVSEGTGGLLPVVPITIFLGALPWMWRRRPALLGALGPLLLTMAGTGAAIMVLLSYQVFTTTERYEVDYTTLLMFGALAVWMILSTHTQIRGRRSIRVGGAFLALLSCVAGLAIGFHNLQAHGGTWRTLVHLGSPVSTAIATAAGHPILAEVYTPNPREAPPESYDSLGTSASGFWLTARNRADLTIVSPDSRDAALAAVVRAGPAARAGAPIEIYVNGPGRSSHRYQMPAGEREAQFPVHLTGGVNELSISPRAPGHGRLSADPLRRPEPESQGLLTVLDLHLVGS